MTKVMGVGAVLWALVWAASAGAAPGTTPRPVERLASDSRAPLAVFRDRTGDPYFLTGRIPVTEFSAAASAAGRGDDFWSAYGGVFGMRDADEELALTDQETDEYGVTHLRYTQRYRGLAVHGHELVLHLKKGQAIAANGEFADGLSLSTTPAVSGAGAAWAAAGSVRSRGPRRTVGRPTLLVHVDGLGRGRLAWLTTVASSDPLGLWRVFVDARTGDVLRLYNDVETAQNRQTYTNANDPDCNVEGAPDCVLPGSLVRSEASPASGDAVVDDPHSHAAAVYQYFSRFGRDSYDGAGHAMRSTVHFGDDYNNAFWCPDDCATAFGSGLGGQTVYGDGDGSFFSPLGRDLDVVAHEWTHAVTDSEANLISFGQPGALNESYSDVFAAMIDPDTNGNEWLIGEDAWTPGTPGDAFRNMANPAANGDPAHMSQYFHIIDDAGGVHVNNGIPNRAAYLAATHPSYGIGRDALEDIYYYALTNCLTQSSDFLHNLQCLLFAAQAVFPGDQAKARAITLAHADVGIAARPTVASPNGGETLTTGTATEVTWSGGPPTGRPFSVSFVRSAAGTYNEGFESELPAHFTTAGEKPWLLTADAAASGARSVRSGVIGHGQRSELHLLVHLRAPSVVSFRHLVSTEEDFDVLSFHVDGVPQGVWSGIQGWQTASFSIPAGTHEVVWTYDKDCCVSQGLDKVLVDDLQIPNLEIGAATVITGSTTADASSEPWTAPEPGTSYRVRVERLGVAPWLAFDESDGTFQTAAAPVQPPPPPVVPPPAPPPAVTPPPAPPPPPQPRPTAKPRCAVPDVRRRTVARARALLSARRCRLGRVTRAYSSKVGQGRIIRQSRRPGARLARGTRVNVAVSRGRRR
jgi:bacillolysin